MYMYLYVCMYMYVYTYYICMRVFAAFIILSRLVYEPLVFCCSSMAGQEKQRVKQLAKSLRNVPVYAEYM